MSDKGKSESTDNKAPKADPSSQAKDNGTEPNLLKSLLKERNRQNSEPSSAFDQPKPVKDGRQRQDSTSSAGFGSSHFVSPGSRRDSDGSALRINVVTEPASLIPMLSTELVANLDELDPQNNNEDGVEMQDVAVVKAKLPEIPETNGTTGQTANGIPAVTKEKSPIQSAVADLDKMTPKELEAFKKTECRKYMKNLLVLCTGFFFVFTAFLSLRNLQSSLNAKGGLGLYALSATYACFFIGCIMATTIVQRLGPKRAIVVSTIGPFLYVLANFYPLFYTLIPAAASAGFCQGVIWTAHATYIANIAASYAELTKDKLADVLSRFNGIFFVFYQSCQIIGGMISSIILKSPEESLDGYYVNGSWFNITGNDTMFGNESAVYFVPANVTRDYSHCGIGYCPKSSGVKGAAPVDRHLVFILVGIFTACCLTGILVLAFILDRLEGQMKKPQKTVGKQLVAVFKFYYNRYAICMVGLMFYSLLQAAFMFGEYNKAFVTCAIGIHNVGFVMMTLSSSSAIAAFVNGRIQKWTTRPPLLTIGFVFQFGVFMTLLSWKPTPADTPVFFILVIFWGIGDGIIMTQDISIIGLLFSHNKEPAFAALKMTQSVANFTFFMAAPYLCTVQKIAFVLTVLLIAATGYYVLELIQLCERRRDKKAKMAEQEKLTGGKEPVKI